MDAVEAQPNVALAVGVLSQNIEAITSISGVDIPRIRKAEWRVSLPIRRST